MTSPKKAFGELLKSIRTAAGLSQADVSTRLGYTTPQFISNWERGVSMPTIEALIALSDLYLVPFADLQTHFIEAKVAALKASLNRKFAGHKARLRHLKSA